jgi:hypothetical protein
LFRSGKRRIKRATVPGRSFFLKYVNMSKRRNRTNGKTMNWKLVEEGTRSGSSVRNRGAHRHLSAPWLTFAAVVSLLTGCAPNRNETMLRGASEKNASASTLTTTNPPSSSATSGAALTRAALTGNGPIGEGLAICWNSQRKGQSIDLALANVSLHHREKDLDIPHKDELKSAARALHLAWPDPNVLVIVMAAAPQGGPLIEHYDGIEYSEYVFGCKSGIHATWRCVTLAA